MDTGNHKAIGEMGLEVTAMRNEAIQVENQAIALVESAIEDGGR
jgi:hypothetical protein